MNLREGFGTVHHLIFQIEPSSNDSWSITKDYIFPTVVRTTYNVKRRPTSISTESYIYMACVSGRYYTGRRRPARGHIFDPSCKTALLASSNRGLYKWILSSASSYTTVSRMPGVGPFGRMHHSCCTEQRGINGERASELSLTAMIHATKLPPITHTADQSALAACTTL